MEGSVYQYYANVRTEPVEWLWYPYIPLGKLTVLQGDPGEGKSTFALNVVARITTGQPMPDGVPAKGKRVAIYQCAEDGIADTIKPRLQQAGADCERVAYIIDNDIALTLEDGRIETAIKDTHTPVYLLSTPFRHLSRLMQICRVPPRCARFCGSWQILQTATNAL